MIVTSRAAVQKSLWSKINPSGQTPSGQKLRWYRCSFELQCPIQSVAIVIKFIMSGGKSQTKSLNPAC